MGEVTPRATARRLDHFTCDACRKVILRSGPTPPCPQCGRCAVRGARRPVLDPEWPPRSWGPRLLKGFGWCLILSGIWMLGVGWAMAQLAFHPESGRTAHWVEILVYAVQVFGHSAVPFGLGVWVVGWGSRPAGKPRPFPAEDAL